MTPEQLVAQYDGDVARFSETVNLSEAEWEEGRTRDDLACWGVGAAVVDDGRVLLVRQRDEWLLPGGMLEPDESHTEGAAREVLEETGVPVTIDGLGAVVEQTFYNRASGDTFEFAFAAFTAQAEHTRLADDPGLDGERIDDVAWHSTVPDDTLQREMVRAIVDG